MIEWNFKIERVMYNRYRVSVYHKTVWLYSFREHDDIIKEAMKGDAYAMQQLINYTLDINKIKSIP